MNIVYSQLILYHWKIKETSVKPMIAGGGIINNKNNEKTVVSWQTIRDKVHKVNKELAILIDDIAPDDSYHLFELTYPYGELITTNGVLNVPCEEGFVPYQDPKVANTYAAQLGYSATPLILQLHHTAEVFFQKPSGVISLNTFPAGTLYGLFEIMQPLTGCQGSPLWHVSSGSRSAFMLPNISDYTYHDKIRKHLHISAFPPQSTADHALIFKEIVSHYQTKDAWNTKVLVFGKKWFSKKNDSREWVKFYNYLYKSSWQQSNVLRTYYEFNVLWEHISPIIKNTHPNFYILATFKNLINLGFGGQPGFRPSLQEQNLLPGHIIEDVYTNLYGLKNYLPILMVPQRLCGQHGDTAVYYSFAQPMLLEGNPDMRNKRNILAEEEQVFDLLFEFKDAISKKGSCYIYDEIKRVAFDFYHNKYEIPGKIANCKETITQAILANQNAAALYPDRVFATTSHFLHGFVRITKT